MMLPLPLISGECCVCCVRWYKLNKCKVMLALEYIRSEYKKKALFKWNARGTGVKNNGDALHFVQRHCLVVVDFSSYSQLENAFHSTRIHSFAHTHSACEHKAKNPRHLSVFFSLTTIKSLHSLLLHAF